MNNREYANTLTDKDFVDWGRKFFGKDWDDASVVMSYNEIKDSSITILNKEHETTADEDLEKLNFMFSHQCHHNNLPQEEYIQYRHRFSDGIFRVYRESMQYNIDWLEDELVDELRKCADKKRKEMGWDK